MPDDQITSFADSHIIHAVEPLAYDRGLHDRDATDRTSSLTMQEQIISMRLELDRRRDEIGKLHAEIASLHLALGSHPSNASVPESLGSVAVGHVSEVERLRAAFLRRIRYDNDCGGGPCRNPQQCGCALEAQAWCA